MCGRDSISNQRTTLTLLSYFCTKSKLRFRSRAKKLDPNCEPSSAELTPKVKMS